MRFTDNRAYGCGGAVDMGSGNPSLIGCVFEGNEAGAMGGAVFGYLGVIEGCFFEKNLVTDMTKGQGGGVAIYGSVDVSNCVFIQCSAGRGGGLCAGKYAKVTLTHLTFLNNLATKGGGLGIYYADSVDLVNSVVAHSVMGGAVGGDGGVVTAHHCDLYGNQGGNWTGLVAGQLGQYGNIEQDPRFVDRQGGDWHLTHGSPCRNGGDGTWPGLPLLDGEGDPRIHDGAPDMGADELHRHLYALGDFAPGGAVEVKIAGDPGATPVGLWIGAGALPQPFPSQWGEWHLSFPVIGPVLLGALPAEGNLALAGTIPSTFPVPGGIYLQALVQNGLTNLCVIETGF